MQVFKPAQPRANKINGGSFGRLSVVGATALFVANGVVIGYTIYGSSVMLPIEKYYEQLQPFEFPAIG